MQEIASMWRGGLSRNPVGWLRQQGWQVETFNSASLRERYGRHTQRDPHDGFLAATRLAKVRRQISRPRRSLDEPPGEGRSQQAICAGWHEHDAQGPGTLAAVIGLRR
jgi:hypothetical protein